MNYDDLFLDKYEMFLNEQHIESLKDYLLQKQGWVYIAYSENNTLLKIGRTGKNPLERAKSLSSTGVLHDYHILFALPVFNQFLIEKKVHQQLKKFRVSKEFFSVNKDIAIAAIENQYQKEIKLLGRFLNVDLIKQDIDLIDSALVNKN